MDNGEFERLMRHAEKERARAIAAADEHYRATVEAIRRVRELGQKVDEPRGRPARRGEVMARVRIAVSKFQDVFTLGDLVKAVKGIDDTGGAIKVKAISSAITRLVGQQVELVEAGKGKRSSRYRLMAPEAQKVGPT